jgi:hypothetical protein
VKNIQSLTTFSMKLLGKIWLFTNVLKSLQKKNTIWCLSICNCFTFTNKSCSWKLPIFSLLFLWSSFPIYHNLNCVDCIIRTLSRRSVSNSNSG